MRYEKHITRAMVRAEPDTLFVFGDNMMHVGRGGQAKEMRGEFNAIGIPTKIRPSMEAEAFFTNEDFDDIRGDIDAAFGRLFMHAAHGREIVWPQDGIGTGLAQLQERAPLIWSYIEAGRRALHRLGEAA